MYSGNPQVACAAHRCISTPSSPAADPSPWMLGPLSSSSACSLEATMRLMPSSRPMVSTNTQTSETSTIHKLQRSEPRLAGRSSFSFVPVCKHILSACYSQECLHMQTRILHIQFYRDKIRAEVEGRTYTAPAPSASNSSSSRPPVASAGSRSARVASSSNNDTWDDWGAKPSNVKVPFCCVCLLLPS